MEKVDESRRVFANRLKKIMKEKDISANKLSIAIGIDRASITKYKKGEVSPRTDTFLSLCSYLEVQPDYFLKEKVDENKTNKIQTEERKIIESLYCLSRINGIVRVNHAEYGFLDYDYFLNIYQGTLLNQILDDCLRFAGSDLSDDAHMCDKIVDKYEKDLIQYFKNLRGE